MEQVNQVIRILKTPVTLLVLLVIVIGAGYWGMQAAIAPIPQNTNPCVATDVGKELTPSWVEVRSLNAGGAGNLAKTTATYLRAYGFNVIRVNNSDRAVEKTIVVGNAVDSPEVKLVQQFFPGSVAEGDGRADHVVDVLLGSKPENAQNPVTTFPVSGKVCLPPRTEASASPSEDIPVTSPSPSTTKKK